MAKGVRVRLYWQGGTVETAHAPIDPGVRVIIHTAKEGTHRHFEVILRTSTPMSSRLSCQTPSRIRLAECRTTADRIAPTATTLLGCGLFGSD